MKKALITEITGQDGFYLAELLSEKGYEVYNLAAQCFVGIYWNHPALSGYGENGISVSL